jgi:hypothetical protein
MTQSQDDPQNRSSPDAIALTKMALVNTRKNLRNSEALLHRSRALSRIEDDAPAGDAESAGSE